MFFHYIRSLIEPSTLISDSSLFIDLSFSSGNEVQSNEVSIIILSNESSNKPTSKTHVFCGAGENWRRGLNQRLDTKVKKLK